MNLFWSKKAPKTPVTPQKSTSFAQAQAISGGNLTEEFAVRQFWNSLGSLTVLPNPDPILRAEGKALSTYRQMVDGHLGAVTRKRRAAVRSRPWSINPCGASARSTELVQATFAKLDIRHASAILWQSNLLGYSLLEVMWQIQGGVVLPVNLKDKPQEWFGWHADGSLRFLADSGLGEPVPERKFLVARNEPTMLNPYGKPLLSEVFWPLAFKRGGLRFWMTFAQKYGMPHAIGKVPAAASQQEREDLLTTLVAMTQDAAAVISDNQTVELHEAGGKASSTSAYSELVRWADTEISKAILGETLSTEIGSVGSLAAAQVHNDVRKDLALDDANLIESCFNQLIDWIYELNFPSETVRPRFEIQMPDDLQEARVTRDKTLSDMGLRFTPEYFADTFRIDPKYIAAANGPATAPAGASAGQFAEGQGDAREAILRELEAALTPEAMQDQAQSLVDPILELARTATSYAEIEDGLVGLLSESRLDTSSLEAALSRMCALTEGLGGIRANA